VNIFAYMTMMIVHQILIIRMEIVIAIRMASGRQMVLTAAL
jgi:hypothetical protein